MWLVKVVRMLKQPCGGEYQRPPSTSDEVTRPRGRRGTDGTYENLQRLRQAVREVKWFSAVTFNLSYSVRRSIASIGLRVAIVSALWQFILREFV